MGETAARFSENATGIRSATSVRQGPVVHVYTGQLEELDESVRIFTIAPDTEAEVQKTFQRVAAVWNSLGTQPGVVPVRAHDTTPRPWIAVPDVGTPLSKLTVPLETDVGRTIIADAAEACRNVTRSKLEYTLLTPRHIRIEQCNETVRASIDLNIEDACRAVAGIREQSAYYPSQLHQRGVTDGPRATVYTLGAVGWYALTGQQPNATVKESDSTATQQATAHSQLSPAITQVLTTALAGDAASRYRTPYEFKLALLFDTATDGGQSQQKPSQQTESTDGRYHQNPSQSDVGTNGANQRTSGQDAGRQQNEPNSSGKDQTGPQAGTQQMSAETRGHRGNARNREGQASDTDGNSSGIPQARIPGEPQGKERATDGEQHSGSEQTDTGTADQQNTRSESGETHEQDSRPIGAKTADSPVPYLSRRTALGALGVGTLGAVTGGAWVRSDRSLGLTANSTESAGGIQQGGLSSIQYDGANTGYAANESGPTDDVEVDWTFHVNGSNIMPLTGTQDRLYVQSSSNGLYAVDPADGTEQWIYEYELGEDDDAESSQVPVLADDTAYIKNHTGDLLALDARDGSLQWRFTESSPDYISPVVTDDIVIVTGEDTLYAVDRAAGTQRWSSEMPAVDSIMPALSDETVYFGGERGVVAVNTSDGSERWSADIGTIFLSCPTVIDDTVFIGTRDGFCFALNSTDGTERWSKNIGEYSVSSPAIVNETVFIGGAGEKEGEPKDNMYALDSQDGTEKWVTGLKSENTFGNLFPIVADETVYLSDSETLFALATADGTKHWSYAHKEDSLWAPVVIDDQLYAIGDERVYALTEA